MRLPLGGSEMVYRLHPIVQAVRRGPVIYPILLAAFPILFLWAHNVGQFAQILHPSEILVPLGISTGFTALILVSVALILRDAGKAGLLVLLFLLFFYSYGHTYTNLQSAGIGDPSRQWLFSVAWVTGFLSAGVLILMIRVGLGHLTRFLNVTAGLLILFSLANLGSSALGSQTDSQDRSEMDIKASQTGMAGTGTLPDIYYIVPDSYASSRILGDLGYDNSGFTGYLNEMGFFIAQDSHSNYLHTELSLASTLNMQYLNGIEGALPGDSFPSFVYHELANEGEVLNTLRSLGYTIINTRDKWQIHDGIRSQLTCADRSSTTLQSENYAGSLLGTTALYPVLRYFNVVERQIWDQRLCEFSMIVDVKDVEGPKFVFSHLRVPHPPFIFDRNGLRDPSSLSETEFADKPDEYVDQLVFVNKKLREVVQAILSEKENPPIIIIQADHGTRLGSPSSDEELYRVRFGIFNALHLPNGGNESLYDSISPVNTFRVILDRYFGTEYGLLEDRSFYTDEPFAGSTHDDVTGLIRR